MSNQNLINHLGTLPDLELVMLQNEARKAEDKETLNAVLEVLGEREGGKACAHMWLVCSTAIETHCLMLECAKCKTEGLVHDPTKEEWATGFYAPSNPYPWLDNDRVTFII